MPHDPEAILRARSLRFAYDTTPVLRIGALDIERGTVTAVIGHNGCGKTTLFKLANGLIGPYTGELSFEGIDVASTRGRQMLRRSAVYVHQHPYIFRERVFANVAFALKVRGVPSAQRRARIDTALAAVGLERFAHRRADGLSGGERQRVALARGLALEPSLLMLDEPTSNIDPTSVARIEEAVVGARRSGTTVLLSTHNLATAYRIADRLVPMEAGRVLPNRDNIYHGTLETGGDHGTARFIFPGGALMVPNREGAFSAAVVSMDDVFLSRSAVATSAQNRFHGMVAELVPFYRETFHGKPSDGERKGAGHERKPSDRAADAGAQEDLYRVRVDCGFPLDALVTGTACRELGIRVGVEIHAGFKASAVQLF